MPELRRYSSSDVSEDQNDGELAGTNHSVDVRSDDFRATEERKDVYFAVSSPAPGECLTQHC